LEENGVRCWVAPRDVVPGREYAQSIVEAIGGSRLTVLVFSAHANSSPHVRRELERTASHGILILPFRVEDVVPAPSVEYFISDAHWLDAMTPPLEQHLDHLAGTVRILLDRQTEDLGTAAVGTDSVGAQDTPVAGAGTAPAARRLIAPRLLLYAGLAGVVLLAAVVALVVALGGSGDGDVAQGAAPTAQPPDTTTPQSDSVTESGTEQISGPVTIEFDDGLGEGWSWENEDPDAWTVSDGALRIDVLQSPPIRNALLRDLEDGDAVVQTRIDFDPVAPGHAAGIALVGEDLGDRVELCWTTEGLFLHTIQNGSMIDGVEIAPDQFADKEWVGAELSFEIVSGFYTARFQSDVTPDWQIHTAPVPDFVTRVALIAYAEEEAGGETAAFTRFVQQ
jgi:hypothetical protein